MKKVLLSLVVLLVGGAAALTLMASRYESKVRKGVKIGAADLSGLSKQDAEAKLATWWKEEGNAPLELSVPQTSKVFARTPEQLGFTLDASATLGKIPFDDFWDSAADMVSKDPSESVVTPVLRKKEANLEDIKAFLAKNVGQPVKARVYYKDGVFERKPEHSGYTLDQSKIASLVDAAMAGDRQHELPMQQAPKRVPDAELERISDVMTEFSTKFSAGQISRSANIKLASQKLNGLVLAPGETFSFNSLVGRRTAKAGFKIAGVYKNGRHDVDLGGGICQVSTTLYNSVLLANMKILKRSNHSMPVPYVPLGRDATVDYGAVDFQFENNYDFPIAINSEYKPGKLTFRVLGIKDPGLKVEIASADRRSWSVPSKTVVDPSLPAGKTKVIERGSGGYSINTFRVVYKDGQEIAREPLGQSLYRGASRIVAVGSRKAAPAPAEQPEQAVPEAIPVSY